MPAQEITVSVLIPAFNESGLIGATIGSVRASFAALPPEAYEIIVCDNNSTDDTAARARALGARVVFEPHNQIARARNAAASEACGRWLIFLDADSLLSPGLLSRTLSNLRTGRIGGGGALLQMGGQEVSPGGRALVGAWNWISKTLNLAAGSYLYCLREAWEATGGFDERVYASEELEFSRRLKMWLRGRGLRFVIITDIRVRTSARKLEWYSRRQLAAHVFRAALPWRRRRRENCALWYERPPKR